MDLTDEQWAVLEPLIPKPRLRADGRDRGKLDLSECFLDGSFVIAKKGGPVRHDHHLENYTGLVHLACMLILLRHL